MTTATELGGEGTFGVFIWPVYVGLCQSEPDPACTGEPFLNADYKRGQINWAAVPDGEIIGRADIHVPAGTYTHLTYHYGPSIWPAGPQLMGHHQLEFPLRFPVPGIVTIDPIRQGDWINTPRAARQAIGGR